MLPSLKKDSHYSFGNDCQAFAEVVLRAAWKPYPSFVHLRMRKPTGNSIIPISILVQLGPPLERFACSQVFSNLAAKISEGFT
jgi:hypothetical protein